MIRRELITAAIKVAADGPLAQNGQSVRCSIKRSLVEELRQELDRAGLGDDWRTMQHVIRREETGSLVSRCKHCNAEIRWAHTPSGSAMPLDPNPDENGNILIVNEPHATAHVLGPRSSSCHRPALHDPLRHLPKVARPQMTHVSNWIEDDGWFFPTCVCGWSFGPVPDAETCADVLMGHAYEAGRKDALDGR